MSYSRFKNLGFTLIEILVVLVLLGLLAGVAVMTLGGGNLQRELDQESRRLHAVLRMAADEAIYSNIELGFIIDDDGYEFVEYEEESERWNDAQINGLARHDFPEWLTTDFQREGKQQILGQKKAEVDRQYGDENAAPQGDNTGKEESVSKIPMMTLLSSGEVTPFKIGLQVYENSDQRIEISSDGLEAIKISTFDQEE